MHRPLSATLLIALVIVAPACQRGAAPAATPTSAGAKARLAPNPFAQASPGDYPSPTPVASVARSETIQRAVVQTIGEGVANKAAELRVESYQTAKAINGRAARPGREFVVIETSWKNIIPLTLVEHKGPDRTQGAGSLGFGVSKSDSGGASTPPPTMESTPYQVPDAKRHLWLLSDGRFADPVDLDATSATPGHLPMPSFTIAKLGQVLRGKIVFEAPAGATVQALQFLDTQYGHAVIPVKGGKAASSPPPPLRTAVKNTVLELAVTEASWSSTERPAPPGLRYYTVGVRGRSLSPTDIVEVKLDEYAFLQTDQGCVAQPEADAAWLARPLARLAPFLPTAPDEGQMVFLVPADAKGFKFLLRPKNGGALDLNLDDSAAPAWPAPVRTIQDGLTLRVLVLPSPARPAALPPAAAGHDQVVLDLVVENMKPTQGIEFNVAQQLRLLDGAGHIYPPDRLSAQLPCRLDGLGVIPAAGSRRFALVYDVPSGQTLRLEYRGFERSDTAALK
ncbi:MAG: hypothetical protein WCP29_12670 [Acidobacteriota bacterium]